MAGRLDGKVALITGASSGLGAHFARVLAAAGAEVVLAARRIEALSALADAIRADGGAVRPAAQLGHHLNATVRRDASRRQEAT